jgi:hypothetical protein
MTHAPIVVLALAVLGAAPSPGLPRGNEDFRLGMLRAQVDSAVAARKLDVISNGTAFLVCASDDPAIEYEQYSFFHAPHGIELLWKVTVGYRLETTHADLDTVRGELVKTLGPPASDTGALSGETPAYGTPRPASQRKVTWVDPMTAVMLGARWSDQPPQPSDRMLVTWIDRRIQRLIEARRKKDKGD